MSISGKCLCGSVRYSTAAECINMGNCHCIDCKKASGSGYAPTMLFPEAALSITGKVKFYSSPGRSGKLVHRGFCPECGSQLFGRVDRMPGLIAVRAGSLDDLSLYKPTLDLFTCHASAWDTLNPDIPKFEELPPRP